MEPHKTLINFEQHTGLGPTYAARFLGVAYQTYASYRNRRRALPLYHARHIRCILLLPSAVLTKEIKEHFNGKCTTDK